MNDAIKKFPAVTVAVCIGVAAVLAGCSSTPSNSSAASTTSSSSASKTTTTTTGSGTGSSVPVTTVPPNTTIPYNPALNARKDVTIVTPCQAAFGVWVATGTVRNSGNQARGYQIVVDFVTATGDTVLDTKIVNVPPLQPAATTTWKTSGAPGQKNVACVIRQVQTQGS